MLSRLKMIKTYNNDITSQLANPDDHRTDGRIDDFLLHFTTVSTTYQTIGAYGVNILPTATVRHAVASPVGPASFS